MAFRDTARDYRRAAQSRFQDARELMQPPASDAERSDAARRHLRGAMYLAGYAVECLLKAYLIQQVNTQTLAGAVDRLNQQRQSRGQDAVRNIARSAAGHELLYLLGLTDLKTVSSGFDPKLWGRVAKWKSAWRYESDLVDSETAREFLEDIEAAAQWLQTKIGGS